MWQEVKRSLSDTGARAWILAFFAALIAMFLYALHNKGLALPGDAGETWKVAKALADPTYHYHSYVEYRGFVVFVLSGIIYRLSMIFGTDSVSTFRFFASLMFAVLSALSLPTLLGRLVNVTPTLGKRLLCVATAFLFFRGYFLYPSNDPIALFFLLLSLNAATGVRRSAILRAAMAGLCLGAAILSRSNYVLACPFVFWLVIAHESAFTNMRWRTVGCVVALLLALGGMFLLNTRYGIYRASSIGGKPNTGSTSTNGLRVLEAELTTGLRIQRVVWNAGDDRYPGTLAFAENRGRAVLVQEGRESGWLNLSQYASIGLRHPIDFVIIYARHLFDGMDAAYPTIYVQNAGSRSLFYSMLNYMLVFSSLFALMRNWRRIFKQLPVLLALALPALSCTPFPIEPRFFMPLSLLLLTYVIFSNPWAQCSRESMRKMAALAACYVIACFAISAHVFYSSLQVIPPPFDTALPFHTIF